MSAQQPILSTVLIQSFAEWCEARKELASETAHTVNQLLTIAVAEVCVVAETLLSQEEVLVLERLELKDIRPLSGFSQLMWLSLSANHIEDVTQLRSLTNLEHLFINNSEIAELTPTGSSDC